MKQKKNRPGRPKGPQKIAVTGLVLPATRREMLRLAQKGTIGQLFERTFSRKTKVFSSAEKCVEPA